MASKFRCRCGEVIRTNLYEGHGLRLLVPEEVTDVPDTTSGEQARAFVDSVVGASVVVAECPQCETLALIGHDYSIRFYSPLP